MVSLRLFSLKGWSRSTGTFVLALLATLFTKLTGEGMLLISIMEVFTLTYSVRLWSTSLYLSLSTATLSAGTAFMVCVSDYIFVVAILTSTNSVLLVGAFADLLFIVFAPAASEAVVVVVC